MPNFFRGVKIKSLVGLDDLKLALCIKLRKTSVKGRNVKISCFDIAFPNT